MVADSKRKLYERPVWKGYRKFPNSKLGEKNPKVDEFRTKRGHPPNM